MKKIICISVICFALNSGGSGQNVKPSVKSSVVMTENQHNSKVPVKVQYTCPMHPEVIKEKPGKCPTCGMNLVKKETVKKTVRKIKVLAEVVYTCPMHPEVIKEKPGKCTTCGMNLVKKEAVKKVETKKK